MVGPQRTPGNTCRDQSEAEGLETCAARVAEGRGLCTPVISIKSRILITRPTETLQMGD